jgi:hypothetical protein
MALKYGARSLLLFSRCQTLNSSSLFANTSSSASVWPSSPRAFSTHLSRLTVPGSDIKYKSRSVQELLSLKGKTIVITGGGRGIGLALTRACVEAEGNVAVLDALAEPREYFLALKRDLSQAKVEYYRCDLRALHHRLMSCKNI